MSNQAKSEPTLHTAVIEKLSHDARGIARIDGKITFIEGALPGETVVFDYLRRKADFNEGRLVRVEIPSDQRVDAECPHYERCGGCSLQHLNASAQIHEKQALLIDILARIGHCGPEEILPPLSANHWHYRNKARLSVRYVEKKQATLVGFREKHKPRYIAEIKQCAILNKEVDAQLASLRRLIDAFDDPHTIAQIEVAAGDQVALIFRNLRALSANDETRLQDFANQSGFRVFLQPGGPDSVYLFHPTDVDELLTYRLDDHAIEFQFHPTDFTQVNAELNQQMVARAIELLALEPEDKVLDLFCGLGNFSLPIAKYCSQVMGIEGSSAMVERARHNALRNSIKNTRFEAANLDDESALSSLVPGQYNKILLDPPRTGALAVVKQMNHLNPERIVYVSCNPATLARDASSLINQGYRLISAGVMDMFPHTAHVESIALFTR